MIFGGYSILLHILVVVCWSCCFCVLWLCNK